MDITHYIEEWGEAEGFWMSRHASAGALKIAKTEKGQGYLRVIPDGRFVLYFDNSNDKEMLKGLRPADPDFFANLRQIILNYTT